MKRFPVYILAGGRSRRFGPDKARAQLNGEPLIQRIQSMVQTIASSVTVVADRLDKYADLGLRTIADQHPGKGPLAGLEAALLDMNDDTWLLLVTCDTVILQLDWLQTLSNACDDDVDAIAFQEQTTNSLRWQPMPALYATRALKHVQTQLASEQRSMQTLLSTLRTIAIPLPADWPEHWQVNTPHDLDHHKTI